VTRTYRQISDDGPRTVIDVDVLDANILISTVPEATECLDLHGKCSHQSRRRRRKCNHSTLSTAPTSEPGENCRGGRVGASHLDCERALDLILRGSCLNHRKSRIQAYF
jgi:hypothetical protein